MNIARRHLLRLAVASPALSLLRARPAAATTIERVVSPRGLMAWLVVDNSLPLLAIECVWRGGAAAVPVGREGLASLAADLLTEGAGDLDSAAFNDEKENNSIGLDFSATSDTMGGSLRALSRHRDRALALGALALTRPRFDAGAIERLRAAAIARVQRSTNDPASIAGRLWFRTAFPDHPYGRRVSIASLRAITRDDIVAFHRARFARDNLIIGVVGDIDAAALGPLLDRLFGDLPERAAPYDVPLGEMVGGGATLIVRRPVPQTYVLFGQPGVLRHDPDYYPALVASHILGGGGFGSRLMTEVRERRGLTYGVSTGLSVYDRAGIILGSYSSDNARAAAALELVRAEYRRMAQDGVTEEELADAKSNINGSFPLRLDSTGRVAEMLVAIQYQNLGIDFIARRPQLINAVTLDDIRRVARRLLDPDKLLVVVAGQPDGLTGTPATDPG